MPLQQENLSAKKPAYKGEPMKNIGIIGFGRIGKVHAKSIQKFVKGAVVKSICDPLLDEEKIMFANELGIMNCYKDYHDILLDNEIDAVLICSSTNTHALISIEAAQAKKHIFCEKPIDTEIAKIQAVMQAVEENDVKFQVGFNRRFDHNFKALRNAVIDKKIGTPHFISIVSRDPDAPSVEYVKVSGGMFLDMTIHDFDMARFLSDSEVTEVYAVGDALVNPEIKAAGDIDSAQITLRFANGAIGSINNSRKATYGYDQRAEVFGSKGSIHSQNDTLNTSVFSDENGITHQKPLYFFLERYMQSFTDEMNEFIIAVENNSPTPVSVYDGLVPVIIAKAALLSLKENRPVKISEISDLVKI